MLNPSRIICRSPDPDHDFRWCVLEVGHTGDHEAVLTVAWRNLEDNIRVCALNFYLDGIVHVPADVRALAVVQTTKGAP